MDMQPSRKHNQSLGQLSLSVLHLAHGFISLEKATDKEKQMFEYQLVTLLFLLVQLHVQAKRKQGSYEFLLYSFADGTGNEAAETVEAIKNKANIAESIRHFAKIVKEWPFLNQIYADRVEKSLKELCSFYLLEYPNFLKSP
ncbi:hypothetical protein [Paenibacillus eucommiae]|uniref:Uncharacterized protein n=1 Tax=Paenibacillus eucommiae TaxID=1355755 RepID=A0ABS4IWA4_9BACL|nr:hypothetical protein [Paenibacillus eucommiae]MBP1990794.1 hypothetical protein [Paenibacillus eucommiae]